MFDKLYQKRRRCVPPFSGNLENRSGVLNNLLPPIRAKVNCGHRFRMVMAVDIMTWKWCDSSDYVRIVPGMWCGRSRYMGIVSGRRVTVVGIWVSSLGGG